MSTTLLSRFGSGMLLALVACALPTKHTGLDNAGGRVSTVGTQTHAYWSSIMSAHPPSRLRCPQCSPIVNQITQRSQLMPRSVRSAVGTATRYGPSRNAIPAGSAHEFILTAYGIGCDAPGPHTKAGTVPVDGFTVAADPLVLPMGAIIHIEGLGERMVHDIGGKVKGRHLDVFMDNCDDAWAFGKQRRIVRVIHIPRATIRRLVQPVMVRAGKK